MTGGVCVAVGFVGIISVLAGTLHAAGDDEVSLFDADGRATAYVAIDDELTLYLWSGQPVVYLDRGSSGWFDVYGFNGRHLGWFVNGIVWDHDGKATCATEERLQTTKFEPFKSFKQFKPFKSFKEYAPFRPTLVQSWSRVPCRFWLEQGAK